MGARARQPQARWRIIIIVECGLSPHMHGAANLSMTRMFRIQALQLFFAELPFLHDCHRYGNPQRGIPAAYEHAARNASARLSRTCRVDNLPKRGMPPKRLSRNMLLQVPCVGGCQK